MFDRTFDEGMALVEETARYLDGKGREEARALPRKAAMLYAGESMRVTTRLMQAASWLLVQRAVRDGDMERDDAAERPLSPGRQGNLPGRSRRGHRRRCRWRCSDLLGRSDNLYRRIARLDDMLFGDGAKRRHAGARGADRIALARPSAAKSRSSRQIADKQKRRRRPAAFSYSGAEGP